MLDFMLVLLNTALSGLLGPPVKGLIRSDCLKGVFMDQALVESLWR